MRDDEKAAQRKAVEDLPPERLIGHDGQQTSFPNWRERFEALRWIRASGTRRRIRGGPIKFGSGD